MLFVLKIKGDCDIMRLKEGVKMSFELRFLGTGAADGINGSFPENFDNKNLRRCSSAIIDGKLLLDCGPHTLAALEIAGVDKGNITDIVVTHLHCDHCDIESINQIAKANPALKLWCREDAVFEKMPECRVCKMTPFCKNTLGEYTIVGVPANHSEYPQHLSVEKNGKKLFYGLDGAWFLGASVEFMKNQKYNAFVFDATVGDYVGDYRLGEHNSIPMIRLMVESMKTLGIIDQGSQLVLSHMAMCLHKSYEETCQIVKNDCFVVGFDGMKLNI